MSEMKIVVDHLRLNYNGPFDANALYRHITAFVKEMGFDLETGGGVGGGGGTRAAP